MSRSQHESPNQGRYKLKGFQLWFRAMRHRALIIDGRVDVNEGCPISYDVDECYTRIVIGEDGTTFEMTLEPEALRLLAEASAAALAEVDAAYPEEDEEEEP